jgi:hypothetical protein
LYYSVLGASNEVSLTLLNKSNLYEGYQTALPGKAIWDGFTIRASHKNDQNKREQSKNNKRQRAPKNTVDAMSMIQYKEDQNYNQPQE